MFQILSTLTTLNSNDIYHFDIKPNNLLIGKTDEELHIKIIDFGLANYKTDKVRKQFLPIFYEIFEIF